VHPAILHLDTRDAWSQAWYSYVMLQQGHLVNNSGTTLAQLRGAVASAHSAAGGGRPVINGEANYEGFVRAWPGGVAPPGWQPLEPDVLNCFQQVNAACVRDTLYSSLQIGMAGYTYGAQGTYAGVQDVRFPGPTTIHGPVLNISEGLDLRGAKQLRHAATFYTELVQQSVDYNLLLPCANCVTCGRPHCPTLLATRHQWSYAIYVRPGRVPLRYAINVTAAPGSLSWQGVVFDPRTGVRAQLSTTARNGWLQLAELPHDQDWLVWVTPISHRQ
jgi:hypothetical protein